MAEVGPEEGRDRRFLTFRVDGGLYALPAEEVSEVIRLPATAKVPLSPRGLIGLANLRGAVLPLASLRGLMGRDEAPAGARNRAIVLDGAAPVALGVDAVETLVSVEAGQVEGRQGKLAAAGGEVLRGAFMVEAGVAKVLDVKALLAASFAPRPRTERPMQGRSTGTATDRAVEDAGERLTLVSFEVAGQEYALPLAEVQEIIAAPAAVAAVPKAEALVLGVAAYRETLLPLISLRGLLGFPLVMASGQEKVVVVAVGGALIGLVADRMRAIVRAEPDLVEPAPPLLAARAGGEARIKAIYRGAISGGKGGSRLVSILDPALLLREDVMQRLADAKAIPTRTAAPAAAREEVQLLVFRLGEEEYGLPISAVDEVARAPDKVTRLPKTPKFLEGVINLRGEVLPVIDQRRRFDLPKFEGDEGRRLVVVRTDARRAGLLVDAVSEVLRADPAAIEPAPDLAGEAERLVLGVLNLEAQGRLILLLDPAELLTGAERRLLARFAEAATAEPAPP